MISAPMRASLATMTATLLLLTVPAGCAFVPAPIDSGGVEARDYIPWWNIGWPYRRSVAISTGGGAQELTGYQVLVKVTRDSEMKPDFSDLRFVQYNSSSGESVELPYFIEEKVDGSRASVWVRVNRIPASGATIHMYYGNPSAASASSAAETFEFYDDFEDGTLNKWSVISGSSFSIDSSTFYPNKVLKITAYTSSEPKDLIRVKGLTFQNFALDFRARDDGTDLGAFAWYDASSYFYLFYCHAHILRWEGKWVDIVKGSDYTTTNAWMDVRLTAFKGKLTGYVGGNQAVTASSLNFCNGPIGFRKGSSGTDYIDNFRVRKYSEPEPKATVGDVERPYRFISFTASPAVIDEGENITMSAVLENPMPERLPVRISFHDGSDFETSQQIYSTSVELVQSGRTEVLHNWSPSGGPHTLWVALEGNPLASCSIYVNRYPVLSPIMDQVASQGKNFKLLIFAEDADGDRLNWSEDCPLFNITPRGPQSAE
ncbi:MAG: DUF2341 domain-containing protein, partial [Thermoplasmata archaeon]